MSNCRERNATKTAQSWPISLVLDTDRLTQEADGVEDHDASSGQFQAGSTWQANGLHTRIFGSDRCCSAHGGLIGVNPHPERTRLVKIDPGSRKANVAQQQPEGACGATRLYLRLHSGLHSFLMKTTMGRWLSHISISFRRGWSRWWGVRLRLRRACQRCLGSSSSATRAVTHLVFVVESSFIIT
jgi:hypothetical protein